MPTAQECAARATDALKALFGTQAAKDIAGYAQSIEDAIKTGGPGAKQKALDAAEQQAIVKAARKKRNAVLNTARKTEALAYIAQNWKDDLADGFEAFLVGVERKRMGGRASLAAKQRERENRYLGGLIYDLEVAGVSADFKTRMDDHDFAVQVRESARAQRSGQKLPADYDKSAVAIGKILAKWDDHSQLEYNNAGGAIGNISDRDVPQSHDRHRIRNARQYHNPIDGQRAWVKDTLPLIDEERTFAEFRELLDGTEDGAKRYERRKREFMDRTYNALITGVHTAHGGTDGPTYLPPGISGNEAARMSHERVIHFKSADAAQTYHDKYGAGNIGEAFIGQFVHRARSTALMEGLGPAAQNNAKEIHEKLISLAKRRNEAKQLKNLGDRTAQFLNYMAHLDGSAYIPANGMISGVSNAIRGVNNIIALGMAAITAQADMGIKADTLRFNGVTEPWRKTLNDVLNAPDPKSRLQAAAILSVGLDVMNGLTHPHMVAGDFDLGRMSKWVSQFHKLTGLTQHTDRHRAGAGYTLAQHLAFHKDKDFDALGSDLRDVLSTYGVDEKMWNVWRKAGDSVERRKGEHPIELISPEKLRTLPDDDFSELAGPALKDATDRFIETVNAKARAKQSNAHWLKVLDNLRTGKATKGNVKTAKSVLDAFDAYQRDTKRIVRDARQHAETTLRTYYSDQGDMAVLQPNTKTRAKLAGGIQRGTVAGEAWQMVIQFKTFGYAYAQRIVGRSLVGRTDFSGPLSVSTIGSLLKKNQGGELRALARMMVTQTMMGYMVMSAKDIIKGRKPRIPNDANEAAAILLASALAGGGLGLYGDFLFGDIKDRFGSGPLESLAGPSIPLVGDVFKVANQFVHGEFKAAGGGAAQGIISRVPNVWYTKAALDYMFLYGLRESLSPGYLRRMEQRLKNDVDQEFFYNPSEYAIGAN